MRPLDLRVCYCYRNLLGKADVHAYVYSRMCLVSIDTAAKVKSEVRWQLASGSMSRKRVSGFGARMPIRSAASRTLACSVAVVQEV